LFHRPALPRHVSASWHAAHSGHSTREAATHAAHAAEHLRKDVIHVGPLATHAATFRGIKGRHAMGIVEVPLVVIGEDFVSLFCSLEADLGFFALFLGNFVRVMR
jgi:hypothetical protein